MTSPSAALLRERRKEKGEGMGKERERKLEQRKEGKGQKEEGAQEGVGREGNVLESREKDKGETGREEKGKAKGTKVQFMDYVDLSSPRLETDGIEKIDYFEDFEDPTDLDNTEDWEIRQDLGRLKKLESWVESEKFTKAQDLQHFQGCGDWGHWEDSLSINIQSPDCFQNRKRTCSTPSSKSSKKMKFCSGLQVSLSLPAFLSIQSFRI